MSIWKLTASGRRGEAVVEVASSSCAALEVGGGPWYDVWSAAAAVRDPMLGALSGVDVDVAGFARALKPFFDAVPGL